MSQHPARNAIRIGRDRQVPLEGGAPSRFPHRRRRGMIRIGPCPKEPHLPNPLPGRLFGERKQPKVYVADR